MVLTVTVEKSYPNFELGKWDHAFICMMESLTQELAHQGVCLPTDKLTIVDVGAGRMQYGLAIEMWARQQTKENRIIAVDLEYTSPELKGLFLPPRASHGQSRIEQLASRIEEASPLLKEMGIEKLDLITLFGPDSSALPNIQSLGELCRLVPVVGAIDSPSRVEYLLNGLSKQGYRVTTLPNPNKTSEFAKLGFVLLYDPLFVALPKSIA